MNTKNFFSQVVLGAAVLCFGVTQLSACSSENIFELAEQPDAKKKGESALARGDTESAIKYLEDAYKKKPNDPEVRNMLANAYMSKAGIDTLTIIETIASKEEKTDWSWLISSLPEGNSENIENLKRSVELINGIPAEQRSDDERYHLAIAQTSLAVVTAKKYGVDENGNIPQEDINKVTNEDASLIVEQLDGAASNLESLQDEIASKGAAKIRGVTTKISESAGDSQPDKVRSFLQKDKSAPAQLRSPERE